MKILMLKGLPGSGKSTWAKAFVEQNPGWIRVNKDDLRKMMGHYRPGKDESIILKWRDEIIVQSLVAGKNIIVDDTNFHPEHEKTLRSIATNVFYHDNTVEFEVKFFDTPLKDCIANDLKRLDSVGEKVIKKMWRQYLVPKIERPIYDPVLFPAIICDLDGTLALHVARGPYDMEKCETDDLNLTISQIIHQQALIGRQILFVTGREDKWREKTMNWFKEKGILQDRRIILFMRDTDDHREDSIIKQEIYDIFIKGRYNVEFVLDDRNRVVEMWRRNGLTCLQVAEGDF